MDDSPTDLKHAHADEPGRLDHEAVVPTSPIIRGAVTVRVEIAVSIEIAVRIEIAYQLGHWFEDARTHGPMTICASIHSRSATRTISEYRIGSETVHPAHR